MMTMLRTLAIFILLTTISIIAAAQTPQRSAITQPYPLELKRTESLTNPGHLIRADGAPWLRLHIEDYKLGPDDYITITSLKDGSKQRLDAKSLPGWRNNSAYFNGDALQVELHATGTEPFVRIADITVGLIVPPSPPDQNITICGPNDDRTAINDPPVGRLNALNAAGNISNPFCTAWAISNGTFLTAGHCVDADPDQGGPMLPDGNADPQFLNGVVEFNVPASQANGTPVFSNANDQYPISTVTWAYGGWTAPLGRDWAVFSVAANSNTGLRPHPSRGFYRVTDHIPNANTENVRVTGYGTDNTPPGTGGGENAQTRTLQSHTGTYLGRTQDGGTHHRYQVDTTPRNSGSPIVWVNNPLFTIGIHTNGGCNPDGTGNNVGTGFGHDPLENAIQTFWNGNSVYVDPAAYPNTPTRDGTIFRPHTTLANGVNGTPTNGNLFLTPGTYNATTVINRAMTIRAPAGTVTIIP